MPQKADGYKRKFISFGLKSISLSKIDDEISNRYFASVKKLNWLDNIENHQIKCQANLLISTLYKWHPKIVYVSNQLN